MRLALSILLVAVTVTGCAYLPKRVERKPPPTTPRPTALRANAIVELSSATRLRGRAVVIIKRPAYFRIEVFGPFGVAATVLMSDGETLLISKAGEGARRYRWSDETLPYSFTAEELTSVLLGINPAEAPGTNPGKVTGVTDTNRRLRYNVSTDDLGNLSRLVKTKQGETLFTVDLSGYKVVSGLSVPHVFDIKDGERRLKIRYTTVEVNPEVKNEIFSLKYGNKP